MTATLLTLQKTLPENIVKILRIVLTSAAELNISAFVVGATARDIILEHIYKVDIKRATEDIDFGVAVGSWQEYKRLKETLIESKSFKADSRIEQRIWWKTKTGEMKVDLVPYGEVESPPGEVAFPPDGAFVMSTHGFAEAYENAIIVRLADDFDIRVVSLAGLAMLKFVAFHDRPEERKRDVEDIWLLMRNYTNAGNEERLYGENASDADLLNEDFDYERSSAQLLGRDIAALLNERTQAIVLKILSEDESAIFKFADVIQASERRLDNDYENIVTALRELKKGITERLTG